MIRSLGLSTRPDPEVEPEPDPSPSEKPSPIDEPIFATSMARYRPPPLSFREAALWSLLAHAIVTIAILLTPPGTFAVKPVRFLRSSEDEPVKMTFVQDRPKPSEPNPTSRSASDRDRRRAQEETPKAPSKMEPYSRGNTPAKIAEGPLGWSAPPAGAPASPSPPQAREPEPADRKAESRIDAPEGTGAFHVPAPGSDSGTSQQDDEALREKGERLRDALAQMGALGSQKGGSGSGVRYKYDNPTGGLSTPTGTLSFDTKGFDWGPYSRRIYWIIWSNWHQRMPPAIYSGLKGQVTIHFVIHKDGTITDIQILSPSGVVAYDNAAVLALEASSPLPPLPEEFPKESDGVTGRFLYNMWGEE